MAKHRVKGKKKSGISTFIATLLLMVLAVSAGVVIYAYMMGYLGSFGGPQTMGAISLDTYNFNTAGDQLQVYVRNIGKSTFQLQSVYVDGVSVTSFTALKIDESQVSSTTITYLANFGTTTHTIKLIGVDDTQISFNAKRSGPTVATYSLTIVVVGSGSVAKLPDQSSYVLGASVQLTANPVQGWAFDHWDGDLTGTESTKMVVIDADPSVTATFVQGMANPALSTTPPSGAVVNVAFVDSATLNGATATAGGTVTYTLWSGQVQVGDPSVKDVINGVVPPSGPFTVDSAGDYYFLAVYSGDTYNNGDTSDAEPFTVGKVSSLTSTLLSDTSVAIGESVTDTATVTAVGGTPTGQVRFEYKVGVGGTWTQLGAVKDLASGSATSDQYTTTAEGTVYFRAIYLGDSTYAGSQSADDAEQLTVGKVQYLVTFSQTGIDSSAGTNIVLTVGTTDYAYDALPSGIYVDAGTTFSWASTVGGGAGKQFVKTGESGSSPISAGGTYSATYKTQHYLTVASVHDSPTLTSGWYDAGSQTVSVTSPVDESGTRYRCTGWTGTGSVPASGSTNTVTFTLGAASSITWNWVAQYNLKFAQSGLDSTAQGTVVSVTIGANPAVNVVYTDFTKDFGYVDSGTTIAYTFTSTVASSTSGKQFVLTTPAPSPASGFTLGGATTVTGTYKTQYQLTVTSTHDTPNPASGSWFDASSSVTESVTSPVTESGTQYSCTGWSGGTGGVPATGSTNTVTFTISGPATITWNWVVQITRVQGPVRQTSTSQSFTVTLTNTPASGDVLIAVIGLYHSSSDTLHTVSSITETGVTWSYQTSETDSTTGTATDTEIWLGVVTSGTASRTITITTSSGSGTTYEIADVCEYSGIATSSYLDKTAVAASSGTSTSTGTTATTSQASELWIGGITVEDNSAQTSPTNGFTLLDGAVYQQMSVAYLEKIVSATGTANSGTTISSSQRYAGCIATFKGK